MFLAVTAVASPVAHALSSTPDSGPNEVINEFAGIHVDGEVKAIAHGADGMTYIRDYHYRLSATNAAGTVHGDDATFALDLPPGVSIAAASGVSAASATLNGTVEPNNAATQYHFEYGATTRYGQSTPVRDAGSGGPPLSPANAVEATETLTGLRSRSVYHARLVAVHADGSRSVSPDLRFETATPTVQTGPASPGPPTVLTGTVDPRGVATETWFEYGTTTAYGSRTPVRDVGTAGPRGVTETVLLQPNVLYHYRLAAAHADGTVSVGADATVGAAIPPGAITAAPADVDATTATLAGTVNPNNLPARWTFRWGTTPAYGRTAGGGTTGSGTVPLPVSTTVSGLEPGQTYHYRLEAGSAAGLGAGLDETFTTPPAPQARTGQVLRLNRKRGTARVRGWVVPRSKRAIYWVQYGRTRRYGHESERNSVPPTRASVPVSVTLPGLRPSPRWHYRVIATNEDGTSVGADRVLVSRLRPRVQRIGCGRLRVSYRSPVRGRLRVRIRARIAGKARVVGSRRIRLRPGRRSRATIGLTLRARRVLREARLKLRVDSSLRPSSGVGPTAVQRRTMRRCSPGATRAQRRLSRPPL